MGAEPVEACRGGRDFMIVQRPPHVARDMLEQIEPAARGGGAGVLHELPQEFELLINEA